MWQLCKEMSVFKDTSKVIAKLAAIWFGQELDWSNDRVKIEAQLLQNHFDTLFVE